MKQINLAVIFLLLFAGFARADISISYVTNQVTGEMYVSGYVDDYKAVTGNATGPYSATVTGMSGTGSNFGSYNSTISTNIAANGSTVTTSGSYTASYNVKTAALLAGSAYSFQEIDFTLASAQVFTLNGTLTNGTAFLYNSSLASPFLYEVTSPTATTLSYSGILLPGGTYEFAIQSGVTYNFAPPGSSGSSSGGFNITVATSAPEPSSLALATFAGLGIAGSIWRRRLAARKKAALETTPAGPPQ